MPSAPSTPSTSAFRQRDPRSTVETARIDIARNRTASGGWEWWLQVGGERLAAGGDHGGVGIFTGPYAQVAEVLPRLLARLVETERRVDAVAP